MKDESSPASGGTPEHRVLIVDDEKDFALSLVDILESRDYQVEKAHNATGALTKIKQFNAQVALLDIRLGRSSGIDLIAKIKQARPDILCVMMTAYAAIDTAVEALQEGAYDYLRKPLDAKDLLATLDRCFDKIKLEKEKAAAEEALKNRNKELEEINARLRKIVESTKRFATCTRLGEFGPLLLEEFARNMAAGGGSLFLRKGEGLALVYSLDPEHLPATIAFPLKKNSIFEQAMVKGAPVLIEDIEREKSVDSSGWEGYKDGSLVVFPLPDEAGQIIGLISLHNKISPPFVPQDCEFGAILASFSSETLRATRAIEELRKSEERYRSLVENIDLGITMISRDHKIIMTNAAQGKMFNKPVCEFIGKNCFKEFENRDAVCAHCPGTRAMATGHPAEVEIEGVRDDGHRFSVRIHAFPLLTQEGEPSGFIEVVEDIADRKQAEEAQRESEERFRELAELLPETIFEVDANGIVTFINRRAFEHFKYTQQDFEQGLNGFDMVIPEDRHRIMQNSQKILQGEKIGLSEYTALRKDGSTFPAILHSTPIIRGGKPIGLRGVIIDVTETKRLEAQFQQAQRMEALGTLAGGIAHDFNNLLMGIQGRTSLMLMDTDSSHRHLEHLKGIEDNVQSATDLTRQLLGFAMGGKYEVKPTNLNERIKNQNRMFGRTKKEITIRGKYEKNLWIVEVDRGQIEQVLLNLYINAWQAMPGGGDLYTQTENVILDENFIKPFEVEPGEYVKISVTDTGVGMDEAIQQRIFDPFFTTKEIGRGTGLGLASAYGIIKNHGGFINIYSEKGEGTTFNIYLPASEKELLAERELDQDVLKGSETVLFVDDEDTILDVGKSMLESLGYKVLIARSGSEAIEIYDKDRDKISIVILDMIMPVIGGGETYDKMKTINPDIKALLSSGYSIDGQAQEILDRGCNGFIQKPFSMKELSQRIRKILES